MNTQDNSHESQAKITALFGGIDFTITYEGGNTEAIRIRQLRLGEYEAARLRINNEFDITGFCCSRSDAPTKPLDKQWVMTLLPESYEALRAKVREVNEKGFFTYSVRAAEEEAQMNMKWIKAAAELPPEVLADAIERGKSASPTLSPKPRPIPR